MDAQNNKNTNQQLDARQQSLAAISALTATGNIEKLKLHLNTGLDTGLTINEVEEALVQLYAYCGFPRSLNGINTFMQVLEERKAKGIKDEVGKEATPVKDSSDTYERGRKTLEVLTKSPQAKPAPGFGEFAPRIDAFLKEHLFADIFDSDVLDYQQRELVTISALAAMTGTAGQLQAHIGMGMNTGITAEQLKAVFDIIEKNVSKEQAETARAVFLKMKK
ncbi:carboxymuconolactone decarboxylase family protein [Niabella sp. CJ426]|uniref:carboxymuconolactone decarboxylase family protein n=1 Tax=Niabella sp. CJ426 TaxID=3393740 RepID=UPI003CFE09F7